jgi:hypothetical protein
MLRSLGCLGLLTVIAPVAAHAERAEPSQLLLARSQDPGHVPPVHQPTLPMNALPRA